MENQNVNQNKMAQYRIKIEERYNGEKLYIPQVLELKIIRAFIQKQRLVWYNIIPGTEGFITTSETMAAGYATEDDALKVIEDYKNKESIQQGKKIKSTTYKYPDSSN